MWIEGSEVKVAAYMHPTLQPNLRSKKAQIQDGIGCTKQGLSLHPMPQLGTLLLILDFSYAPCIHVPAPPNHLFGWIVIFPQALPAFFSLLLIQNTATIDFVACFSHRPVQPVYRNFETELN